jgi:hypothetical protein
MLSPERKLVLEMAVLTQTILGAIRNAVEDVREGKLSFEQLLDYIDAEYAAIESGADGLYDDAPAEQE